jgi:hypothetical protein
MNGTRLKLLTSLSIAAFLDGHIGAARAVTNPGFKDLVGVNLGEQGAATSVFSLNPGEAIAIKIDDADTVRARNHGKDGYALAFASSNSSGDMAVAVTSTPETPDWNDIHTTIKRVIPTAGAGALKLGVQGQQPWHIEQVHGQFYVIANLTDKAQRYYFQGNGAQAK